MLIAGSDLQELANSVFPRDPDVHVGSSSIDIRIGSTLKVGEHGLARVTLDSEGKPEYHGFYELDIPLGERFVLKPGNLYIAHSLEWIEMPPDVAAFLALRSSAGRRGIDHLHAGYAEPGWKGQLTFELSVIIPTEIIIGERIAQLVFFRASSESVYAGQYQMQIGPTLAGRIA